MTVDAGFLADRGLADADVATRRQRWEALDRVADELPYEVLHARCEEHALLPPYLAALGPTATRHYLERLAAHGRACEDYEPGALDIPVHLFAAEDDANPDDAWMGWDEVMPLAALRRVPVPGTHHSMVARHARALAAALQAALADDRPVPTPTPTPPLPRTLSQLQD